MKAATKGMSSADKRQQKAQRKHKQKLEHKLRKHNELLSDDETNAGGKLSKPQPEQEH